MYEQDSIPYVYAIITGEEGSFYLVEDKIEGKEEGSTSDLKIPTDNCGKIILVL